MPGGQLYTGQTTPILFLGYIAAMPDGRAPLELVSLSFRLYRLRSDNLKVGLLWWPSPISGQNILTKACLGNICSHLYTL